MTAGGKWSIWKLALLLYPFAMPAVAINLFMLGLMGQAVGLPALSPGVSIAFAVPLGVTTAHAAGRWVRGLMDEAG